MIRLTRGARSKKTNGRKPNHPHLQFRSSRSRRHLVIRVCQRPIDISSGLDLRLAQRSEILCKSGQKYLPAVDRGFEIGLRHPRDVSVARVEAGRLGINPPQTRPSDLGDRGHEGRIHPVGPGLTPPESNSAARSNHGSTRCVTAAGESAPGGDRLHGESPDRAYPLCPYP